MMSLFATLDFITDETFPPNGTEAPYILCILVIVAAVSLPPSLLVLGVDTIRVS